MTAIKEIGQVREEYSGLSQRIAATMNNINNRTDCPRYVGNCPLIPLAIA